MKQRRNARHRLAREAFCNPAPSAALTMRRVRREDVESLPLVLKLLYERHLGKASRRHIYMDNLPRRYSTPVSWTDAELAELQYPSLTLKVRLIVKLGADNQVGSGSRVVFTVEVGVRSGTIARLASSACADVADGGSVGYQRDGQAGMHEAFQLCDEHPRCCHL